MKSGVARVLPFLVLALSSVSSSAIAQAPAAASKASFGSEISKELADVEKKLVTLAEAMPAEKFGWRPAEGVRSVSEVYVHVAGGNYMLPTMFGFKRPEGMVGRDME
ncbi:MAG TPA: damage-inducible protein DinB, partial [Thermoanaerobaculia bacterium]